MTAASFEFEAIGTHWRIDIAEEIDAQKQDSLLDDIKRRIFIFNQNYSRFQSDSLISQMTKQAGEYTLPPDAKILFDTYKDLYGLTGGAFTPLMGNVLEQAGYDKEYSLTPKELSRPPELETVMRYDFPKLILNEPVAFDFGAAGKGYIIDIVSEIIERHGVKSFCVDAGGDIFYKNSQNQKLRVGLEHPHDTTQAIGVVELLNNSVCGSAGNRRAWGKFNHIIDPRALESPKEIIAVWTVAKKTILADALATCLFFVPPKTLLDKYEFEYVILFKNFSAEISKNFPGEIFTG